MYVCPGNNAALLVFLIRRDNCHYTIAISTPRGVTMQTLTGYMPHDAAFVFGKTSSRFKTTDSQVAVKIHKGVKKNYVRQRKYILCNLKHFVPT